MKKNADAYYYVCLSIRLLRDPGRSSPALSRRYKALVTQTVELRVSCRAEPWPWHNLEAAL